MSEHSKGAHGPASHAATTKLANGAVFYRFASDTYNERARVEALKSRISFSQLLRKDGRRVTRSGGNFSCTCPFHADSTPSFAIYDDRSGYCFGCGWGGDVFAYIEERDQCDFTTAKEVLEEYLASGVLTPRRNAAAEKAPAASEPYRLSREEEGHKRVIAGNLCTSPELCEAVAKSRSWKYETIEKLAREGSLGWYDQSLAFLYDTGVKIRPWPWRRDGIRWFFGKPNLWRGGTIGSAKEVYLAEGETDCISLIDSGICTASTTVVAAPSATTFKLEWAVRLHGKTVVLCFDNDEAGQKGVERVSKLLAPYTQEIYTLNLEEVGHVS